MFRASARAVLGLALLLVSGSALAQTAIITGNVIDENGEALIGANVGIEALSLGSATDIDGFYRFEVPAQFADGRTVTLQAQYVGYEPVTREVVLTAGETTENFQLTGRLLELDELVVTGVSQGTSTLKTGFAISKISEDQLEQVPGTDPASAIRAKSPGVRVIQPSGRPGEAPEIRLRGSKSIGGDQSPLIVIDGAITSGDLSDIDMQAVESIEIIKGAAASSLYGSLAGNGVVQIITKRGTDQIGQTRVTLRTEAGFSSLAGTIDLAEHHGFEMDADAEAGIEQGQYRLPLGPDDPADGVGAPRGDDDPYILDNPFTETIDQQEALFQGRPFITNFVSVASRQNSLNYLLSFENLRNSGVVEEVNAYQRNNIRLNIDNQVNDRLNVSASTLYSASEGPNNNTIFALGQGANIFYGILLAEPDLDLTRSVTDPETGETIPYNPFIAGGNAENPLYVASTRLFDINNTRLLGNFSARYGLTDWWSVDGQFSYDRETFETQNVVPKGNLSAGSPPSLGSLGQFEGMERTAIYSARSLFNKDFGQVNGNLTLSYTYEDREGESVNVSGTEFRVPGVPTFGNINPERITAGNGFSEVRAENLVANALIDLRDRYVLDGVIRRDGLSLFGEDVRYQTYYRVAGAYRLSEDVALPSVQELKLRASYGTSGQRPPFAAQYETFNVTSSGIVRDVLGNSEIRPSRVSELEVGLDAFILNALSVTANYADAVAEDQFLLVPLSAGQPGNFQWQNAGTLESRTFEVGLNGLLVDRGDFTWDFNLTFDRTTQEITELNRPAYTLGPQFGAALPVFRVEEGVEFGAMFGNQLATSVDELPVGDDGIVFGSESEYGEPLTRGDFAVNDEGYVIRAGTEYTADEKAMFIYEEDGSKSIVQIGKGTPDFNVGFGSTFRFGDLSLYTLVDWEQGGDVYNYTKQLLYFNSRHGDLDQADRPEGQRHYGTYYEGNLYNRADPTSHFVEDASFVKVREIALTYNFGNDLLTRAGLGGAIYDARLSVIGRNLFTFTGYTGYDPEVAVPGGAAANPTNFRIDEFTYPNFRTYALSLQLRI